ncbi:MAG: tyrosine-protein phosphatase [Anaerolineae bacterium]|nr:tyrosine-protein phosphatase [Anaerolineae bacterium]
MQTKLSERVLKIEGGSNIRDIGGYSASGGKVTRWKTIVRSAGMDQITAAGQHGLLDYGVRHIIDLRDVAETMNTPNVFAKSTAVYYCNCPVIGMEDVNKAIEDVPTMVEMYTIILERCRGQIKNVLETIAQHLPNGPVVIHCWAGKDRTGIITALLLGLVGVPAETIAQDYAMSYELLADRIEAWRIYNLENGIDSSTFDEKNRSRPETMLATLDYLDSHLGGIESYLRAIGLSDTAMNTLRTHLVEDPQ